MRIAICKHVKISYLRGLLGIVLLTSVAAHAQLGGVDSFAETGDCFGRALASGDFNGDGYEDLAVGLPFEGVTVGFAAVAGAGAVEIIYGTANGLASANRQFWHQGGAVGDQAEVGDAFGYSLVAADFNRDGFSDLAIGVPFEDIDGFADAGAVSVIYGSPAGLSATTIPTQFWHQGIAALGDTLEANDRFGWSLAAGRFSGGGSVDLAVGVPFEGIGRVSGAGAVNIIYSSPGVGLDELVTASNISFYSQDSPGIGDQAERDDHFGWSLAVGNFNGDLRVDLAIGVPDEDIGSVADAGAVNVLYCVGCSKGKNEFWHQDSSGILDVAEPGDGFGYSLAAGNFSGDLIDHFDDLAIGVPGESLGSIVAAGGVNVIYGSSAGLSALGNQFWNQDSPGVDDTAEPYDLFGYSLAAGDFNAINAFDDLAIGVPYEGIGSVEEAGGVNVLYGNYGGLQADPVDADDTPDQFWQQNFLGDAAEPFDHFGKVLVAGKFTGVLGNHSDLAVGVPNEDLTSATGNISNAGGVNVIYGSNNDGLFGGLTTTDSVPEQFWTQIYILPPI